MTTISDSTRFLMDPQRDTPETYNNKITYESDLVTDAATMNTVHTKGYPEKMTFQNMFPPVCLKSHWDSSLLSKYVLPQDLRIPLPVDPRPMFRNCLNYFNMTPITTESKNDALVRSKLEQIVQPGGNGRGVPFEVYAKNIDRESDLYLNHPQDKCDDNKWHAKADSDLYTNTHRPLPLPSPLAADGVSLPELTNPLAAIVNKVSNCRTAVDTSAWSRSARVFNNPTREDRMPGHMPRLSDAPLGSKGPKTGRVSNSPRVWSSNSVVFYSMGNNLNLYNLAAGLRDLKYEVTIFSTEKTAVQEGISYHHVSEFIPNDIYSSIVLWGRSELLDNFQYKPQAKSILLNLDEEEESEFVCERTIKDLVDKIVVKSAYHRSKYNCYTWSKFEVIPSPLPTGLFTGQNRFIERMPHRVLVTEYSPELVLFIKIAWPRLKAEFKDAELHVWETPGDNKADVLSLLTGMSKHLGVYLHGVNDLEGMVKERFASRCQIYLEDYDQVSCESVRLSALAGCIPIMPERGVYNELRGINIPGKVTKETVLVEYAKAVSGLFKNESYAYDLQVRCQMDPALKGAKATAERWLQIINGLRK